ncbi:MAG TPA: MBL fold metallo-hydrolase [Gammaproteobacteria bacterium]|nr:MBL fold metallo-hydrolase [Gammaproteobacteria bacterium]
MNPQVKHFFDKATWTLSYVVYDAPGGTAAIIDSVLDYDPKSGRTKTDSAEQVLAFVRAQDLDVAWILETHAHADHMSASQYLREQLGGQIGIGVQITRVQETFKQIFNLEPALATDGSQFDRLFADGERFAIGRLTGEVLAVPGHTPACVAYRIGDALFVGDTMFMPDVGTARCDFPGGDARTLYKSIRRLLDYPADTRIFVCHDYPPAGREVQCQTTVAAEREANIHVHDGVAEEAFVDMRTKRDATLEMPTLILPAIQINIRAGAFPPPEDNGTRYLKIPLNAL